MKPVVNISGKPVGATKKELGRFTAYLISVLGMDDFCEISVSFCSPSAIKQLNSQYRNKDVSTDILSFHLPGPIQGQDMGDIYLSPSDFKDEFGLGTAQKLLFFLVSHGFLHLQGWTHESKEKFEVMMAKQRSLLEAFEEQLALRASDDDYV